MTIAERRDAAFIPRCFETGGEVLFGDTPWADRTLTFVYGPEHQRIRQTVALSGTGTSSYTSGTTWYLNGVDSLGLAYEKHVTTAGLTEHKHYVSAGSQVFALQVTRSGNLGTQTTSTTSYLHTDHLGSVAVITDAAAAVAERLAYDPWGKRRFASGLRDNLDAITGQKTDRGYTLHEHLDEVGVVHMNARVYDPLIGRFMSADSVLPDPTNLKAFNRYSYVSNNPLGLVDSTGHLYEAPTVNDEAGGDDEGPITLYRTYGCQWFCMGFDMSPSGTLFTQDERKAVAAALTNFNQEATVTLDGTIVVSDRTPQGQVNYLAEQAAASFGPAVLVAGPGGVALDPVEVTARREFSNSCFSLASCYQNAGAQFAAAILDVGSRYIETVSNFWLFVGFGGASFGGVPTVAAKGATRLLQAPRQIEAAWGASTYRHGGLMTGIEHVMYRHGPNSGFSNVSRFAEGTRMGDISRYVDSALRSGTVTGNGLGAYTVEYNFGRTIGTDVAGNAASSIRVHVRDGIIQTAFPF